MSKPTIEDSKKIAKKYKKDGVIIFHFDTDSGKFGYASYGKDKEHCNQMRGFADTMMNSLTNRENDE